jgi:polyhydroxyalkanoate synthesis regulator phasin
VLRCLSRILPLLLAATACVDHGANAATFCTAVRDLVSAEADGVLPTQEEARAIADDVAKAMRHAEDGTRQIRGAARDLSVAYDDLTDLLGDDDATGQELDELRNEVQTARVDVRAACANVQARD